MKPNRKHYTLAELVFTSCIGATVLLTTMSAVQGLDARKIACTENLRNLGTAVKMYGDNNKNFVPCQLWKNRDGSYDGSVLDFGNYIGQKYNWSYLLIWGGYLGEKPQSSFPKGLAGERGRAFLCPEDTQGYTTSSNHSSYYIHVVNDIYAVRAKRFGGEQYSRVLIGRDRPENSVVTDIFSYKNSRYKKATHGDFINVLRLGGEVEPFQVPVQVTKDVWSWIGEDLDEIEL